MNAALTVLLRLDSRNLQSQFPPVGSAAPSWILTRTPGDQPNSLKLRTVITAPQSGGCDSECLPVGNLWCQGHISPSHSAKFGDHRCENVTSDPARWRNCFSTQEGLLPSPRTPSSWNRLTTRIHFCWLGISCCYCVVDGHIIVIRKKKDHSGSSSPSE